MRLRDLFSFCNLHDTYAGVGPWQMFLTRPNIFGCFYAATLMWQTKCCLLNFDQKKQTNIRKWKCRENLKSTSEWGAKNLWVRQYRQRHGGDDEKKVSIKNSSWIMYTENHFFKVLRAFVRVCAGRLSQFMHKLWLFSKTMPPFFWHYVYFPFPLYSALAFVFQFFSLSSS